MPNGDSVSDFDVRYVKGLYDELNGNYKRQADTLSKLERHAGETNILLKNFSEKQTEQKLAIGDNERKIRDVERRQDSCTAAGEIKGIKYQLNRLVAFKDMVMSKTDEDSQVIDVHAQRMKHAVEVAMTQQVPRRVVLVKYLPWFIVVFVVGVVMATLVTIKAFAGESDGQTIILPDLPQIELKTNSSSQ